MNWQGIIVAAIVIGCVFYLARRWYRMIAGKAGGGCGCSDCPTKQPSASAHREP